MNSQAQRVGVVIQGPLVTYGQGPNNTPQGFDASIAISTNVEHLTKRGFSYVVCTWKSESTTERQALEQLRAGHINVNAIDTPEFFDPDHRYKHHYGVMKGLEFIEAPIVVKIRTDMVLPDNFWDWVTNIADDRLVVSELITPFYLGDFVYAGRRQIVMDYLAGILDYKSRVIHPSITTDLGLKYFEHLTGKNLNGFRLLCSYLFKPSVLARVWGKFATAHIRTIPPDIYQTILWRGRSIQDIINVSAFKFDTVPPYLPADIDFLLGEYTRFYTKRNDWRRYLVRTFVRLLKIFRRLYRIPRRLLGHHS